MKLALMQWGDQLNENGAHGILFYAKCYYHCYLSFAERIWSIYGSSLISAEKWEKDKNDGDEKRLSSWKLFPYKYFAVFHYAIVLRLIWASNINFGSWTIGFICIVPIFGIIDEWTCLCTLDGWHHSPPNLSQNISSTSWW